MTWTDEELVARSRGGDLESFNQLILRWERPIYALAYRVIGREDDARDVCQEAFLRAFRALPGFKGQAKFSSWLYRITLNLCRDWIRRHRRAPVSQIPEGVDPLDLAAQQRGSRIDRRSGGAARVDGRSRGGDAASSGGAADCDYPEGISRDDVSGDRGPAGVPVEHREDSAVSGTHCVLGAIWNGMGISSEQW